MKHRRIKSFFAVFFHFDQTRSVTELEVKALLKYSSHDGLVIGLATTTKFIYLIKHPQYCAYVYITREMSSISRLGLTGVPTFRSAYILRLQTYSHLNLLAK